MYDDAINALKSEVDVPRSQSCTSENTESYLSDHELDVADPTCHGEITQDEECESHVSQSQSEEQSAYISNVLAVDGNMDLLDQSNMQEMNSLIERLHYVENVIKSKVERHSPQYENEEVESHISNDGNEFVDLTYCEEASCEDNGKGCCSSQEEDSVSTCSSTCESDANWEEESNDGSEYSNVSKGMSSISKSESEGPVQSYTGQLDVESCEELSTQYEDKEIVYKDRLPNFVDECLENECNDNQHTNDSKVDALAPIGKINNDRIIRHLNHLHDDNENNFDSYYACFVNEVNDVSLNDDSDSPSSHDQSVLDSGVRSGFKVYTNALYGEDPDDDQLMFFQDVQQGSLHGVINPLFEENSEFSNLVELGINDDELSYCCEKSVYSSPECDSEYTNQNFNCDYEDKVFDEMVIENSPAPCNEFYDGHSNVKTNLFADCEEPFEDYGLVSNYDIDDMCEYQSDCSLGYHPDMHKETQFQGVCDPFPYVEYEAFIFKNDSMHDLSNKEQFQFQFDMFEHADQYFHNKQTVENESSFYMRYESQGVDSVLLSGVFPDVYLIGNTDMSDNLTLPHVNSNENQVYDRGKKF